MHSLDNTISDSIPYFFKNKEKIAGVDTKSVNYNQPITISTAIWDLIESIESNLYLFVKDKRADRLEEIKSNLNRFFDAKCLQLIYTENLDNQFFGVMISPVIDSKGIFKILQSEEKYIVDNYYLEIDSKLFSSGLSNHLISVCIVQHIASMVLDSIPMDLVRKELSLYLLNNSTELKMSDNIHYKELFTYGIKNAMRKLTSFFTTHASKIPGMIVPYSELIRIQIALISSGMLLHEYTESPIVVLSWVLRLYSKLNTYRIAAIHTIKRAITFTGSVYEKKELNNIIRRLERIDDFSLMESSDIQYLNELKSWDNFKRNAVKKYEDDLYEIKFEINNVETSDEAMLILHRINSKMSVIRDYLGSEKIDSTSRKNLNNLLDEFNILRKELSKKRIYQNKTRLYVNYGMDD